MPLPGIDTILSGLPGANDQAAGLNDLGVTEPSNGGNIGKGAGGGVDLDGEIQAIRAKLDAAAKAAQAPAPGPSGSGAAGLMALLGGVGGALLGGAQGGLTGFAAAGAGGLAARDEIDAATAAEHAAKVKTATDYIDSRMELAKGLRMIQQAQPGSFSPEMMPLVSEAMFPFMGRNILQSQGLHPANAARVEMLEFMIKSKNIKDPKQLAAIWNQLGAARGFPVNLNGSEFTLPTGDINPKYAMDNFINGQAIAQRLIDGESVPTADMVMKPDPDRSITIPKAQLQALDNRAKLMAANGWNLQEAFTHLNPTDQSHVLKYDGSYRATGLPSPEDLLAIRTRLFSKGGSMQEMTSNSTLGSEDYLLDQFGHELNSLRAQQQDRLAAQFRDERDQDAEELLRKNPDMTVDEARDKALVMSRKRWQRSGAWSGLDSKTLEFFKEK